MYFGSIEDGIFAVTYDGFSAAAIGYDSSNAEYLIIIRDAASYIADASYSIGFKTTPDEFCAGFEKKVLS